MIRYFLVIFIRIWSDRKRAKIDYAWLGWDKKINNRFYNLISWNIFFLQENVGLMVGTFGIFSNEQEKYKYENNSYIGTHEHLIKSY